MKRPNTDYIDIYYMHHPIRRRAEAPDVRRSVRQGKIRYPAMSIFNGANGRGAVGGDRGSSAGREPGSLQPEFRSPEREIIP
jgi:aryl-alcohol dehydrogenase-like predicted oxidoreductase